MTLSHSNLDEIANLYESIATSDQEQLDEIAVNFGGNAALSAKKQELAQQRQSTSRIDALRQQRFGGSTQRSAAPAARPPAPAARPPAARPPAPAARPPAARPPAPAARPPAAAAAPATGTPKPAPSAAPKGDAMSQWAKANPKLAAASAERARTRGTSATTNPQMADLKSRLPAPKPAPVAAARPAPSVTTPQATSAAGSSSPASSGSVVPVTNKIAAAPRPIAMGSKKPGSAFEEVEIDSYDLVLEYLLSQGHAETIAEAEYIMTELDGEVISEIIEFYQK